MPLPCDGGRVRAAPAAPARFRRQSHPPPGSLLLGRLLLGCLLFWPSLAGAAEPATWSLIWENDVFGGTDRNYTNGLRASYVSPEVPADGSIHRAIAGWLLAAGAGDEVRYGVAVGQSIFTPEDVTATQPLPDQHPYAGWLYGEYALFAQDENSLRMAGLQVGLVGPGAGARFVQNGVHDLISSTDVRGWSNQLRNEVAFALILERRERAWLAREVLGQEFDVTPHWGLSLGTLRTQAKAGVMLRFGDDLQADYGPPRVRPALGGNGYFKGGEGFGWYVFGGLEARAVARNIFLDGNTWQSSPKVTRLPFVADLQAGIAMTFHNAQLAYTFVTRTKEFVSQGEAQQFGSISLSVKF